MAFDFSNISDEELEAMAAQSAPASEPMPQKPLSEWTDEELEAYAAEPTPAPALPAAQPPRKLTREERIAQNQRAIETARSQEDPGFLSIVGESLAEGARGAGRALKSAGQGVLGTVTSAVRLAGTPVRMATGWDGIHRLADKIDSSYANFGRDALMSEYGENPDGWGYALGRAGEKVAGVAGSLAGLGAAGKAVQAASGAAKMAGLARTAKVAENALPLMFGNDAAVRAYDTARANGKGKAEAAALAGLNGTIHFFGFKAFENQSLKKMLNIGPEVEVMMPKWANALADEGGQSFSSLVRGTRNGMVKYIAAENGKRALKAGGIMGLQDMLSDPVMQVAEGASIDDIDFSRMLKAGAHGVGEGALMEGLMGGAAIFKSQKAAKKFIADKYFRGKDYKVMGADGKMHDEPGLLDSAQGRMTLMKQNPDTTERVLDIVEHGGKPTEAELDAAFLPPDMTTEELKKFASDWRKDLEPYVDEAWAADAPRQTAAPNIAEAGPSRDILTEEEAARARQQTAADSMMLDFESWNRLYADRKTDLNFDEWRAAGKPGVIEANLTPKTEEAKPSETRTDEAPTQPEQGEVAEPPAGEAAKPVEGAEARAEAANAGVVEPSAKLAEGAGAESPSVAESAQPAEKPPTTTPKPPEAQTPAEPAKPVEAASRASDAKPAVSAPDKASDAQKTALAKLGEGKGVVVTSAEMGKGGVLHVKYTMPSADGKVVEFDSTIDAEGKTSTSVAGVKSAPAPAVQTGEATSPETPAPASAPATQAQTNIPNEKNFAAPAPKSNRLRRVDGTDPLAEREQAASQTQSPESPAPSGAEAPEPISPRVRKNRADKLRSLLDFARNEDGSFNPDALRNQGGNNGFELKYLKEINEHPEIVDDLGLPAEETAALKSALTEAFNFQSVNAPHSKVGKVKDSGGFDYSVKATNALKELDANPDDIGALARAQLYVKRAIENLEQGRVNTGSDDKQREEYLKPRLAKIDERVAKLNDADVRKFVQAIKEEEAKVSLESRNESGGTAMNAAENKRAHNPTVGSSVKFSTFEARMNENGEIVISRDRDVKDEFGHDKTKKTEVAISEEKFRAMAKQFGADPDALLEKMRGKGGVDLRAAKSDAADLPDAWTPETQKPLERVANALRNVVTVGGKKVKVEFLNERPESDGPNAFKNADGVTVGDYADGKIRLYPGAKVADVVHEFTHPLVDFARAEAKAGRGEFLNKIKEIIDAERETWEQPVRDAYKDKGEEEILEEIFTHAMGEKGEKLFGKSTNTLQGRQWYKQLWEKIKGLWQDFATKMGWNKADLRGLDRMSPEDAAQKILSEMAKGRSFGDATTGGEGTRNAMVDSSPSTSIPSRLGKIKDWFSKGGEDNYVFKNHPADWSMHDTSQPEFDRVSKESRLAEAVGRLENPSDFWKAFLPTGTEKVVIRTKNGNVALLRDVYKYLSRGRFGYTTATERAANGKFANAGALHFLLNGHIAEGGYKTSKSVLTAKEINDNFQRCLDSPVKYDKKNRPYHEVDIGHGVKMHIGTAFIRVDGKMSEVPITIESNRRDEHNRRICERVAKEMSEGSVHLSAQGGAATSTRTDNSVSNPPAESQGGVRESRRVVLPQPPTAKDIADWLDGKDDVRRKWRRALQDKNIGIRDVEEKLGITDKNESAYYAKDRAFGKNEHELTVLQKQEVEPIVEKIHKSGGDLGLFSAYLYARHAGERNAVLKAEKGVENGSGMNDAQAKAIFDAVDRQGLRAAFEDAAKDVWAMNRKYLQRRVDAGRMTQAEADFLTKRYQHYVPLRTDMTNEELDIFNSTTGGWKRNETMTAKGRKSAADDPLAFSIVQNEQAIRASNANEVRKRWAGVVRRAKGELGEIVDGVNRGTAKWAFTFGDGETVETGSPMKLASERDDIILFKENGQLKAIKMKPGEHGRGLQLARAVTDKDVVKFNEHLDWIPRATRWMSAMRTQYVPTFIVRNLKADNLEVMLNALSERGLRGENGKSGGVAFFGKFLKNEVSVAKGVKEYFKTGKSSDRYVQEAVENGLLTGGGMAAEGFTETARRLSDTLQALRERPKLLGGTLKAAKDTISLLNSCAEYNTRMGVYKTLREEGMSVADAVSYARDVTVNFNRKGYLTPYTNAAFMFSNAAIQGMGRAFKSMGSEHGKGVIAGLFMVGVAQALLDDWLGHDDEKEKMGGADSRNMTEYDKEHSLGVALPTGHRVKTGIRNPWALPVYAGRKTVELVKGITSGEQAMKDLANAIGNFVTEPVGGNGFGSKAEFLQTLAPTIIDPFVQWGTGKDYRGQDRLKKSFDKTAPQSWNGKDRTPEAYKLLAQGLNALTGGNEFRKGWGDSAPEDWQLLTETVFGGVLTDLNNLVKAGGHAVDVARGKPAAQIARDVPFVRDTVTNLPENTNRYYAALDDYERDKAEYKKTTDLKRRAELGKEKPYLRPMVVDGKVSAKSAVDTMVDSVKELMHLERGEVKAKSGKWIVPKVERTEAQKEAYRKRRLALQARILKRLGR